MTYNPHRVPHSMLSSNSPTAIALLAWLASVTIAYGQVLDFRDKVTPTCEIAGLVVTPPGGWINVPIAGAAPKGHLGCQMMRTNEREELVAVLRVRSATEPAPEFAEEGYASLLQNERAWLSRLGYVLAEGTLWTRDNVPVSGAGFRDARGMGVAAHIEGNQIPQEGHFLVFRSDRAKYLFTLLTPAKASSESLYNRNTDDFGVVIRTLKPRGQ